MNISQIPADIIQDNVKYTVKEITNTIKKYGPRESGTEAEFSAQKHMAREMEQWSDEVKTESFTVARKGLLAFTKIDSVVMVLALTAYFVLGHGFGLWLIGNLVLIAAFLFAFILFFGEFIFYKKTVDGLCQKSDSHNVIATRRPAGETKRRIIISGHADSAYEWPYTYYFREWGMRIFIFPAILLALLVLIYAIGASIAGPESGFALYGRYVTYIAFPFSFTLYFFANFKRVVPGANDNLTGCYAAICSLRMLEEANINLEHTEVVALITGSEESGLRGAKAWAQAHAQELLREEAETIFIGVDTLKDMSDFNIYHRDMTGLVKHDDRVCSLIQRAAKEAGYDMKYSSVYFGASDAAAITQAKLPAACIAAMDPAPPRYYHTRLDNYDILEPKAIEAGLKVVLSAILAFDEKGLK